MNGSLAQLNVFAYENAVRLVNITVDEDFSFIYLFFFCEKNERKTLILAIFFFFLVVI